MGEPRYTHNEDVSTKNRLRRLLRLVLLGATTIVVLLFGLAILPVISPSAGAAVADGLRAILGPQPVADIESLSFQIQDVLNRTKYQVVGDNPQVTFADTPGAAEPTIAAVPTRAPRVTPTPNKPAEDTAKRGATAATPKSTEPTPTAEPPPAPSLNVLVAPPYVNGGWQSVGPLVAGQPVMARSTIKPDPTRPYAYAAAVRIDLSQVDLHFQLGTMEPVSAKGTRPITRTGSISDQYQIPNYLLAAFNGGFKSIHGNYGVIAQGQTVITPQYGIASIAIYRDGSIDLGAWGRDINPTDNLVDLRQNCPLLLDGGQINPTVSDGSRKEWGYTVKNLDTTWRSGIGITRDGRFLIYVAGNSLTVQSLAQALQIAGAYHAMQLDINGFYTRFALYRASEAKSKHPVIAEKLLNEMTILPNQFLDPYDRDFFFITLHRG